MIHFWILFIWIELSTSLLFNDSSYIVYVVYGDVVLYKSHAIK